MIILEEDECTPLKGDSTTPVSPSSPSQLSSPDSPPSYNEAVVPNSPSRHPSYDAIPIPESFSLESQDHVSDKDLRRRRNKRKVHLMLLFLALTGCIVFWLTFAIFFAPGGLARDGGKRGNEPPGPPPDGHKGGKPWGPPLEEEEGSPDNNDGSRGKGPPPGVEGAHVNGPHPSDGDDHDISRGLPRGLLGDRELQAILQNIVSRS